MASVFLSYDREDADRGRRIARALEKAGHSVWWDRRIKSGAQYSREIDEALKRAEAIVVLWSEKSIDSAWVRDEAAVGRDTGKLVPVRIDVVDPPLGFRQYQTTDLTRWKGRSSPELAEMLDAVEALAGEQEPVQPTPAPPKGAASRISWPIVVGIAAAVVAAALFFWRPWDRASASPIVAVVPVEQNASTNALARDLLVKLGKLQATSPDSLKLVGSHTEEPDLILEVGGSSRGQAATATLALRDSRDGGLLWSKDYQQPSNQEPDLRQQLAYSAAQVLGCAAKASAAERKLGDETRRLYLNGCAELAQSSGEEIGAVVPLFEKVTRTAPKFRDAWAKLLTAESSFAWATLVTTGGNTQILSSLRRHIAEARTRHGEMPEAILAELEFLPDGEFAKRLRLIDRAKELGPDNPHVLEIRAGELMRVGRMNEAVFDAERALELDPLSPAARSAYISTLAYAGRLTRAAEALKEAERLWPGASSVHDAKYRFHLRYGDPAIALELFRTRGRLRLHELTIHARLDPTPENVEQTVRLATAVLRRFGEITTYAQELAQVGREDQVFATLTRLKDPLPKEGTELLFRPTLKRFREDPRFMLLTKRMGLLDYWRTSGNWPDFCFDPDLPYDCRKEAAKLAG